MEITSKSISRGVGGSYTKWQRKPPAHRIYQVETPDGTLTLEVYAENRALDEPDHATVQLIEDANGFAIETSWDAVSPDVREAVREHFDEKVADDEWFN